MFNIKEAFVDREFQCMSGLDFQEIKLVFHSQFLDTSLNGSCGLHEQVLSDLSQSLLS